MTAHDNRVTRRATTSRAPHIAGDPHATREVRGMLRVLEQLGFDLEALLASAGLRRQDVEDPDAYLSPGACATVFARARAERRVPNLALQLARRTPIGATPLLDYLILSSDSVAQGLARLVRYLRLVNPGVRLAVRDERDPVRVVVERASGAFEIELTVSLSVVRFTRETGDRLRPAYVSFSHEPDDAAGCADAFRCPVRVRAAWNGWALSRAAMALPLMRRDPVLGRWLERQAADILARLPVDGDVRDEVRHLLSTQMTVGDIRIGEVARRLATTPRTLQRRLSRAGTSFDALCDAARKEAAQTFLADTTLSIAEVTYLLGYSEPTAFHRAFRRWYQTTPQAFRARMSPAMK